MIRLTNVCRDYHSPATKITRRVLSGVSFTVMPGDRVGILGQNGAGKSTLIRLIGGADVPTSGTIERKMSISWPVGFHSGAGGFMTGYDTIRFVARIYARPVREVRDYVEDFAQLGKFLSEPIGTYSTGMQSRLIFALSLAVDFDCYLIDEVIAVGDHRFQQRSYDELHRKKDRALILASHVPALIREWCTKAVLLHRGRAKMFDNLDLATDILASL